MESDTNCHSVFSLNYHLILVIKYRRKVIDDEISNRLKIISERISTDYNITVVEWNHDKNHVHILFKAEPNRALSKFINVYTSEAADSSRRSIPQFVRNSGKNIFGHDFSA